MRGATTNHATKGDEGVSFFFLLPATRQILFLQPVIFYRKRNFYSPRNGYRNYFFYASLFQLTNTPIFKLVNYGGVPFRFYQNNTGILWENACTVFKIAFIDVCHKMKVQDTRYKVQGARYKVQGTGGLNYPSLLIIVESIFFI